MKGEPKITIIVNDEWEQLKEEIVHAKVEFEEGGFHFSASITQDNFCCGLCSIGDFITRRNSDNIPRELKVEAVRKMLGEIYDVMNNGEREICLQFTLIDTPTCDFVTDALEEWNGFTLVKEFKNLNSGNVNRLYISK